MQLGAYSMECEYIFIFAQRSSARLSETLTMGDPLEELCGNRKGLAIGTLL